MIASFTAANFLFDHPRGPIYGYITDRGVRQLALPNPEHPIHPHRLHSMPNITLGHALRGRLENFFIGAPETFEGIPLDDSLGTPFQQAVWRAARAIPWGETRTYGQLAAAIGNPKAARAIGQALHVNPLPILVPCHRIVATGGGLGGFGAGMAWKKELLTLEGRSIKLSDR